MRRLRVRIATARGRSAEALDLLLAELAAHPETIDLDLLMRTTLDVRGSLADLAATAPEPFVVRSLREAFGLTPVLALQWFEALFAARPADVRVLVAGSVAAARSNLQTALTWSVRAREAGRPQVCALRRYAAAEDRRPVDAGVAWALLADAFGEAPARRQLLDLTAVMTPDDLARLGGHLRELAPDLVDELPAAATQPALG